MAKAIHILGFVRIRVSYSLNIILNLSAIKIGRYTLQHKTENINQVKSVESLDKMIDVAMTTAMDESSPSPSIIGTCI